MVGLRTSGGLVLALCAMLAACSDAERGDVPQAEVPGAGSAAGAAGTTPAPRAGSSAPRPMAPVPVIGDGGVPDDFTATELGGYKLGEPVSETSTVAQPVTPAGQACSVLVGVVRDFRGLKEMPSHPDFEAFEGRGPTPGLVAAELGNDGRPVYASVCEAANERDRETCPYGQMTTSREDFDQWYRTVPDVNLAYVLDLAFVPNDENPEVYTFQSDDFFPLDETGWGNGGGKRQHNFGFTTEVHTRFEYRGGESFSFTGDDDLWVFVDGRLAIDLGGLHPPETATVELDSLGLTPGETYALDLFHAERHSAASNFRVDTSLAFTTCGQILGPE